MREWLREARGGRTQQSVANEAGIAQGAYSAYESGERTPRVKTAKKIAAVLGIDWTRFYEEEQPEA